MARGTTAMATCCTVRRRSRWSGWTTAASTWPLGQRWPGTAEAPRHEGARRAVQQPIARRVIGSRQLPLKNAGTRSARDQTHELRKNFANLGAVTKRKRAVTDQCEGAGNGDPACEVAE